MKTIKTHTGKIYVDAERQLEFLTVGDYGKENNIKAEFLGLYREINGVKNTEVDLRNKWVATISTQKGCPMCCKFCLLEDAPILMEDYTYKKIKDIKLGDRVISVMNPKVNKKITTKQYASNYAKISNVTGLIKRQYSGDLYVVSTKNGKEIVCTKGHPIACKYKTRVLYMPVEDLTIGDKIVSNKHSLDVKNEIFYLGWTVGFIEGDGCYDEIERKRWQISQNDYDLLALLKEYLSIFNISTTNIWENTENNYRIAILGEDVDKLNNLIKDYENNHHFMVGYISGFWDAEGFSFKNNQNVRVCNTNISLINKFREYARELGYSSSLYCSERGEAKPIYTVNVSMSRDDFNAIFTPKHKKRIYLSDKKNSRCFCVYDEVIKITKRHYDGIVYNIETSEHSYFAYNILTHNCDVPKYGFYGNASIDDLKYQIETIIKNENVDYTERFNVHFARMGEPTWNKNVLDFAYMLKPLVKRLGLIAHTVHPVVSTMLPIGNKNLVKFLDEWCYIKNHVYHGEAGLQFSINSTDEAQREELFAHKSLPLSYIERIADMLPMPKGRKYTLNFPVTAQTILDAKVLSQMFEKDKFIVKITPIHETASAIENGFEVTGYADYDVYRKFEQPLLKEGWDVIVFVPSKEEDSDRITCGNALIADRTKTNEA